jgi:hypothetical protein
MLDAFVAVIAIVHGVYQLRTRLSLSFLCLLQKSDIRKPVGLQSRSSLGVKRSFGTKASPSHLIKKRKLSDGEERVTHSDAEEMDEEAFGDDTADRPPTRTKTYSSNFRPVCIAKLRYCRSSSLSLRTAQSSVVQQ